jgi:regulatory protein
MAWRKPARDEPAALPPAMPSIRTAALLLLGRRDYTVVELRRRLTDRGYPENDIDTVVANLVADGSLNDQRVAAAHARTASGIKGRGRHRIQRELDARGVSRDLARDTAGTISPADETAAIDRFLDRKHLPARPDAATRRRVFQQLIRRGFPSDAIAKALRRRGLPESEDEA